VRGGLKGENGSSNIYLYCATKIVPIGAAEKCGWGSGMVGVGVASGVGECIGVGMAVADGEGDGISVAVGSGVAAAVGGGIVNVAVCSMACGVGAGAHDTRARLAAMSNNFTNRISLPCMSITATPARLQSRHPQELARTDLLSSPS
jgi:hypothetical protein